MLYALLAALLFGVSIPLSKSLLGSWHEVPLAGTIYLSSGLALLGARPFIRAGEPLRREHLGWLAGIVLFGALLGGTTSLYGLRLTTGYAAALLINLETVFTTAIAVALFRERLSLRAWTAIALLVVGASAVGWGSSADRTAPRPILGGCLLAFACLCWGFDNNFSRKIASCDPLQIVGMKGLIAGTLLLGGGAAAGLYPPADFKLVATAAGVGLLSYGASITLFVLALRKIGSAKTSGLFASSAIAGLAASWIVLGEIPRWPAYAGGAAMLAGVLAMIRSEPADVRGPGAERRDDLAK